MNDELRVKNNELGGKMNYRYRTDEEMKDSGIEWLGKMPKSWNIRQLKRVLIDRKENNSPVKTDNILSLTMEKGVIPYSQKGSGGNKAKEDLSLYKLVYPDDIVLNSMNVVVGSVGLSKYFGCASPAYYMLYKKNSSDSIEYYNNIFQSKLFQDSLIGLGNGILVKKSETSGKLNTIRMRIPMEKLNLVKMPIPKSNEQEKIAKFLDEKTAQFDSIISKKEALIEKLGEAKKSLISEVVTGKVKVVKSYDGYELVKRKKEEMKDSGVEWLGDIPKEWDIKRLKYLFEIKKDIAGKLGYDVLSVTQSGIKIKDITKNEGQLSMDYSKYQLVEISDFIMNHMDLLTGFVDCSKFNGVTSPDYRVFKLKNNNNCKEYYNFIFQSCYYNKIFYGLAQGVSGMGRWRLQTDKFLNFVLPLPSINEQRIIAEIVEKKVDEFKKLKDRLESNIEKLKEAKQSLISEAVTGKIEIL